MVCNQRLIKINLNLKMKSVFEVCKTTEYYVKKLLNFISGVTWNDKRSVRRIYHAKVNGRRSHRYSRFTCEVNLPISVGLRHEYE